VWSIEAHDQSFSVFAAGDAFLISVKKRRRDLESHALIVERGYRIADYLVRQLENSFLYHVFGSFYRPPGEMAGNSCRCGWIKIEDHPAFNVPKNADDGCHSLAPVGLLFHGQVADLSARLQRL